MRAKFPLYTALLLAAVVMSVTIRYSTFTPWGTDSASYINAAQRWAEWDLFSPEPFHLWPRWRALGVPLGNTHTPVSGTYVTMYPLGFPVLLSVGHLLDSDLGVYIVGPFFAGVLVLATFLIAQHVTTTAGALLAALLVSLSPIVLIHSVTTMSDVPATALLMLAIAMALRLSMMAAVAAALAMSMTIMTRPVLAPLAIVPLALLMLNKRWKHAAVFAAVTAIGPALLAWSQLVLYGGALKSGYPGFESYFGTARIPVNAKVYLRTLSTLHTPFLFLGLAAVVPLYFTRDRRQKSEVNLIAALIAMMLINYALYLPYMTYDDIWSTRFLLPAQIGLFILLAVVTADAIAAVTRLSRWLAIVCVIPAAIVVYQGTTTTFHYVFGSRIGQAHVRLMGHYLRDALPRNAVVITFLHGGGIAYHTGAQIARFDLLSSADAQAFVEALVRRRYVPVFVIDFTNEATVYAIALHGTPYERLDWPERAASVGFAEMLYLAAGDREQPRDRLPLTDVLRAEN